MSAEDTKTEQSLRGLPALHLRGLSNNNQCASLAVRNSCGVFFTVNGHIIAGPKPAQAAAVLNITSYYVRQIFQFVGRCHLVQGMCLKQFP